MNKQILIISPYFPPSNAADAQRVRMSLPYLQQFGWKGEVMTVHPKYSEMVKDDLLMKSVPVDTVIYKVNALSKAWTAKFGLGSLGLRSLWFLLKKGNKLLRQHRYDLVYFSTTQFPVCVLGAYWKKRFGIPYVIDMQDPWHSDYYQDKPADLRPPKYWFSYRLNKYLEPLAMKSVSGLVSVSEDYITTLKARYPGLAGIPAATIPFGAFAPDMDIARDHRKRFDSLLDHNSVNLVYIGRGGADMSASVSKLFRAFKKGLETQPETFKKLKLYFIGTSYAPEGLGRPSILPVAAEFGVGDQVIEITDRISYYHTLLTLQQADALFIPGSDDPAYTASKIYPYLLTGKPLLAIFHPDSPAIAVLRAYGIDQVYDFNASPGSDECVFAFLSGLAQGQLPAVSLNEKTVTRYSAENMTQQQCELFDQAIR